VSSSTNKYKCILIEKILEKDIVFFDIFKTGELLNKIEYCENHIQNDFIFKTFSLIQSISKLILMAYYLYRASSSLMIVFTTIFFVQIGTDYILDNNTSFNESFDKGMASKNKYLNKLTEIISNIRMVKSFVKEKDEVKKIEEYKRLMSYDLDIISSLMFQLTIIVGDLGEAVTLLYAGKFILQKKFTLGQFTIFKQYQIEFKISYEAIKNMIKNYRQLLKDWKIFFEIYDFPVKIYSLKNYIPKNILGQITFDKVKFAYPLKPKSFIFDNLSFQIPAGKTFAICGFSGSGKTTISNLIQRFYDPNEGRILIDGVDLRDYNIEFLRRNIGFVAQEPVLNSGTIEENITYGVDTYKKKDFEEVCKLSNINSFVNDKNLFPEGLKTLVGERGTKVSGGQKQRIAIARALMKNSKILIFDEATSALDAESEAQVQGAIDNVVKKRGITIIIIAHRLSTIMKADCIAVINNGKIVEM
jgi:ABC-type multidrug transport system fused ATPase/permease subunit